MSNILIVGAGLSGATLARKFAEDGHVVTVIDKRDHLGGNVFDYVDEAGVRVAKYGAHIFHTSDEGVWEFVNRFTKWLPYEHRVKSMVNGQLVPVPANIDTFNMILGSNFTSGESLKKWIEAQHPEIKEPKNSEESALKRLGSNIIYELMFKNYTKKQWDRWPHELEASVMDRIPVRFDHNDRYFSDTHEGIPAKGYTTMVENMLAHSKIELRLNTDYFNEEIPHDLLFFTGKIDTYFDEQFGKLEYRSLRFEHETLEQDSFQDHAVVNYPSADVGFTRIVEHKKFYNQIDNPRTTITREYSIEGGEPYYPVPNPRNREVFEMYKKEANKRKDVHFVGRLANYKYFNMDQAIRNALDMYEELKEKI